MQRCKRRGCADGGEHEEKRVKARFTTLRFGLGLTDLPQGLLVRFLMTAPGVGSSRRFPFMNWDCPTIDSCCCIHGAFQWVALFLLRFSDSPIGPHLLTKRSGNESFMEELGRRSFSKGGSQESGAGGEKGCFYPDSEISR